MTSIVSYFLKYSSNCLKSLILVEIEVSLKTAIFLLPPLVKKKCKMMHFEITRIDKRVDIYQ